LIEKDTTRQIRGSRFGRRKNGNGLTEGKGARQWAIRKAADYFSVLFTGIKLK
jgi:hypothetical protein